MTSIPFASQIELSTVVVFVDATSLVSRLRANDASAFDAIYEAHHDRVYAFLFRLAGRRDVADDLFQETWLSVARSAGRLRDDTNLSAWIFTIARNAYRSHRRWSFLDLGTFVPLEREDAATDDADPERRSATTEERRRLERCFARLGVAAREALLLVTLEGFDQVDAAAILGISHAALRQRISRARTELARLMEDDDER